MPNYVPPSTVPADINQVQEQAQDQSQYQQSGDNVINSKDESRSDSNATSANSISQSPISSNTQVNYSSSGEWQFQGGIKRQEISVGLYTNYNSRVGGVDTGFTVNIPIGGKSSKLSTKLIESQNYAIALDNATRELSLCNSLFSQNLTIDYSMLPADHPAQKCNGLFLAKTIEVPKPLPVLQEERPLRDAELKSIREDMTAYNVQLRKFQIRLDELRQVKTLTPANPWGE